MASAVSPVTTTNTSDTSSQGATGLGSAPTEDEFLQLLVAQLQNQDPMNPTDSTQFVSQLAQFSELEQVIAIRQDLDKSTAATQAATGAATGTGSGAGTDGSTGTGASSGTGAGTPAVASPTSTQQTTQF